MTSGGPALLVTATPNAKFVHNVHEVQVLRINPETGVVRNRALAQGRLPRT